MIVIGAMIACDARAEVASGGVEIDQQSKIFNYIVAPPQLETMLALGRKQDQALRLKVDCKDGIQVHPRNVIVLATIDLPDGRPNPVKGFWQVRYDLHRCGKSKSYNVIFAADPAGGKAHPVAYFPGNSLASVALVREAMVGVGPRVLAKAGDSNCKRPIVSDMRVDQGPHPVEQAGKRLENVWNETWTFDVCGRTVDAAMTFVPTLRDGGTDWSLRFPDDRPNPTGADR